MLVRTSIDDHVAMVRLDDAAHRNALSPELVDDLTQAIGGALEGGARAIVLSAEPPVFCAGGSLDSLLRPTRPLEDAYRGFEALWAAPVPTIAAVAAPAIGAGVNLPLCCDVVLASPSARFDPRFLDVGIHPGGGHLWRLASLVGVQGAAAMVLLGDALDGEEAARAGLAWRCVPDDRLEEEALAMAHRAAERDPALVVRTKETLRRSIRLQDPDEAARLELEAQRWSMARPEFAAAVEAIRSSIAGRRTIAAGRER